MSSPYAEEMEEWQRQTEQRLMNAEGRRRSVYLWAAVFAVISLILITAYDKLSQPRISLAPHAVAISVTVGAALLIRSRRISLAVIEYGIAVLVFVGILTDMYESWKGPEVSLRAYLSFILLLAVWFNVLPLRLSAPLALLAYLGFSALTLTRPHYELGALLYLGVVATVLGVLSRFNRQVSQEQQEAVSFQLEAQTDALTGLVNRRGMHAELQRLWDKPTDRPTFALFMADIDFFKRVNDEYGHTVGDVALRQAGQSLRAMLGPAGLVARWGGEEFMLLLRQTDAEKAYQFAGELNGKVFALGEQLPNLTFSAGAALSHEATTLDELLALVDRRLHAAKDSGRNQVKWDEHQTAAPQARAVPTKLH